MTPKAERLRELFRRIERAPAAPSLEAAFKLVCNTINAVEDELTTIAFDPAVSADQSRSDGRMYPPRMDSIRAVPNRDDVVRFPTRGHTLLVGRNGAIQIWDRAKRELLFSKVGADGKSI